VLLVTPTADSFPGGVAVQAELLAKRFNDGSDIRMELMSITPKLAGDPVRWAQRVPILRTVVTTLLYLSRLIGAVRRFDIVHVNSARFSSFLISSLPAVIVAKIAGRPVLLHYHNGNLATELRRYGRIFRWLLSIPDTIVVPSRFLSQPLTAAKLAHHTIANQVDLDRFRFRLRRQPVPILLSCRHFEDWYDIPTLIRAFHRIQAVHPHAQLVLAGRGSREPDIRRLIGELGLRNVTFLGQVGADHMPEIYDQADLLLNSSIVDNAPASLIEALASGLPIVTTNSGGIPFLVTDRETGRLVPPGDAEGLARQALDLLAAPDELARMTEAGRAEAESRYSWAVVEEQWRALYRQLAAGKR
jgi:glycosyltransferase involved in cell wall biosynthesis